MAERNDVVGVQYLRGLAALAVVANHASGTVGQGKYFGGEAFGGLLVSGRIGADLFFLISGFIITIVSLKGPGLEPAISRRDFFARRFARIVPLMWVAILSYAALRMMGRGLGDVGGYVRALFLLPWDEVQPAVIWTLRQELVFYLVFALAMLGARHWRVLMLLWIASPFAIALLWNWFPDTPLGNVPLILFHGSAFEFGAGVMLGILWLKRSSGLKIRLPVEPLLMLALAFAVPLALSAWLETQHAMRGGHLLYALACAPVMFLAIHAVCPPGLGERIGRLLGDASYSIYLFHPHILSVLIAGWAWAMPATPGWLVVVGSVGAGVAGGIAIHRLVEKPLVAWARRFFEHK